MIIHDDKGEVLAAAGQVHVGWNPIERTVIFTAFAKSGNGRTLRISFERGEMEGMMAGIAMALFELDSPYVAANLTATVRVQDPPDAPTPDAPARAGTHDLGPLCEDSECIAAGTPHGHTCPVCGHGTYHPAPEEEATL